MDFDSTSYIRRIRHAGLASTFGIALVGGLLAGMFGASPVLAGAGAAGTLTYRPDGWVRFYAYHYPGHTIIDPRAWKGDDIYNNTGWHQTARQDNMASVGLDGNFDVFQVTIQNDGSLDRFRVAAAGTGSWVVQYYRGKNNITSAVVAGTYQTPILAHGDRLVLRVKVWIGDPGTSVVRRVTISSVANPNRSDTVRIKDSFTGCGC